MSRTFNTGTSTCDYENGTGVLYPTTVRWAQLSNTYREVGFVYEPRQDAFDDYRATFSTKTQIESCNL